jgi:hypothetical protein
MGNSIVSIIALEQWNAMAEMRWKERRDVLAEVRLYERRDVTEVRW